MQNANVAKVFVQGRVVKDEYSGGQRITAERVCDLPEARAQFAKRLRVRLNQGVLRTGG